MDSERIQPGQENKIIPDRNEALAASEIGTEAVDEVLDEEDAAEAREHTEAALQEVFESLSEDFQPEADKNDEDKEIPAEAFSESTEQALYDLEQSFDDASDTDERRVKAAWARESRYYESVLAEDNRIGNESENELRGLSRRNNIIDDNMIAAWSYIKNAQRFHTVVRDIATVTSAIEFRTKTGESKVLAGVSLEFSVDADKEPVRFQAYMYLEDMYVYLPNRYRRDETMTDAQYNRRCKTQISHMIGATIPVVITQAVYTGDAKRPFQIFVSRREAMLRDTVAYFSPIAGSGAVRTKAGDRVSGRIVEVGTYKVTVNVRGIDCEVYPIDLTWRPVNDPREEYAVNDRVEVEITELSWPDDAEHKLMLCRDYNNLLETIKNTAKSSVEYRRAESRLGYNKIVSVPRIKVFGSKIEAIKLYKKHQNEIQIGTTTSAIVTNVYFNPTYSRPIVRVYLDKLQMMGYVQSVNYARIAGAIEEGAMVTYQINGVNKSGTPFLVGEILNVNRYRR